MRSSPTPEVPTPEAVWDPQQYLRHADHRTRPFADLLARIDGLPRADARIADLGCGAGNVTALLAERWPTAHITGYDNSPAMLERARREHGGDTAGGGRLDFAPADIATWAPDGPCDLIVSNAAFHWVDGHTDLFGRWTEALVPGGVLAFQVPGNFSAPSHTLLTELCRSARWRETLGDLGGRDGAVREPREYLSALVGLGCETDVWETTYLQLMPGEDPVLDWVKGTLLRPVLTRLGEGPHTDAFLTEYATLLRTAYPPTPDGTVFPFRRLFAVARVAR
ncbi:trans-aconitate 2-methyltransferase [Streptomyces sp. NPDC057638]|uniref:trans-aconitate 2-methyltransferase n=1 Tax=Streptomyces sp. NPDC057638 TaxID=3346190 RepID=UPI00369C6E48